MTRKMVFFGVLLAFLGVILVNGVYAGDTLNISINKHQVILWGTLGMSACGFLLWTQTGFMYPFVAGCGFLYCAVEQMKEARDEKIGANLNNASSGEYLDASCGQGLVQELVARNQCG